MPRPEQVETEEPQPNAGLLEFINRRRMHQARQRRHRVLVAATAALALIAVVLALSNVLLIKRLAWRTETPAPPASASSPPPVASAPARPPDTAVPAPPSPTVTPSTMAPSVETHPTPPAPEATRGDSARRTARWMVQTHGRLEAENRAAKVAEFYSGPEGAFWRRVLLNVRQEPER
jgi:cytoskeletal protein RodZ